LLFPILKLINFSKDNGGIVVNEQRSIPISIGNYKDKTLCDVVTIDVGHI